jgi:hypothetical protein
MNRVRRQVLRRRGEPAPIGTWRHRCRPDNLGRPQFRFVPRAACEIAEHAHRLRHALEALLGASQRALVRMQAGCVLEVRTTDELLVLAVPVDAQNGVIVLGHRDAREGLRYSHAGHPVKAV